MKKRGSKLSLYFAITTLTGTIIGAGVLAIPYALAKAGFLTGLLIMCILSIAVIFLYLYLGETILRTKGKHQLTGYAGKYLGRKGKEIMAFSMVFGNYGALIAYIIGVGVSLAAIFSLPQYGFLFSILFFIFASAIVYIGLKAVKESELLMSSIVITIILIISAIALFKLNPSFLISFNLYKIFIPYGVILFALAGAVALPEMREELEGNEKLFKKAIVIGSLIPIILYLLFSLVTVGVCGSNTSEIAPICLGENLGLFIVLFGNIFAIFAMTTSFLALGLGLREMYNYDYKIKKFLSWFLTIIIPLFIFLLITFFIPQERFFKTIGITGGVAMTLEGILIVLMHGKSKKMGNREPEFTIRKSKLVYTVLIIIFILGAIYTILNFLGIA